jgi:hypothetical protein
MANRLNQFLGHPADGRENFAQRKSGQDAAALLDPVFAFPGGTFFQRMIHRMANPACLLNSFAHGEDQAGDRVVRPLLQVKALGRMVADPVATPGFAEVGMAIPGVNQDDGHLGLVSVTLADHFGGRPELAGSTVDGGDGAQTA